MPGNCRSMVVPSVCKLARSRSMAMIVDVWTGDVAEREREGAAAGAEVGPDATPITVDSGLDQLHVIGVVHQTTPQEGVDTGRTRG